MPDGTIDAWVADGVGHVQLNRPKAINALSLGMLAAMRRVLDDFAEDPRVCRVDVTGAGERGFCSGADVRWLREQVLAGADTDEFFETEYALNLCILNYPKPYRVWMTGITMGGGLGVSMHGSDRVVTPTSELAMPETQIGLFPDVFARWHLSRMPHELGTHLALTGLSVRAGDALWLRLADRCDGEIPSADLVAEIPWIQECYAGADAVEIVGRLAEHSNPAARETAAVIRTRCPMSVAVALEAVRRAALAPSPEALLDEELRLARALVHRPDFVEGVRAQLVDKDRSPRWTPARLEDVTAEEVAACFG